MSRLSLSDAESSLFLRLSDIWQRLRRNVASSRLFRGMTGQVGQQQYILTRWLFLRLLGIIYLIAFLSFATQALSLIGSNGITPVHDIFPIVEERFPGIDGLLRFPTLLWLNSSDTSIMMLTTVGIVSSLLLIVRVAPALMLLICWVIYLSIVSAGQIFMSFQWDSLLLETGFLAIFLAPWNIRPSIISSQEPSRVVIWAFRWLLFRLMFASGMVKLLSGDPTWYDLTALTYHYETQPLPNPLAWFFHQAPIWFHQIGTLLTFFVEIPVTFLFFAPRRLRLFGAGLTILLQIIILLTGNYTFFNLLTIALCILLLDDSILSRLLPNRLTEKVESPPIRLGRRRWLMTIVAILIALFGVIQIGRQVFRIPVPQPVTDVVSKIAPLRLVNTYGLFAIMTTERPQIMIEGSMDGEVWHEYGLRFQPQLLTDIPPIVAPHQPRLDWQLWFAALGEYQNNRWFVNLVERVLEGSPEVLVLFESNPFPDEPPRYIRALRYDYAFSDWQTLSETGEWWQRQLRDTYLPAVSLDNFESD